MKQGALIFDERTDRYDIRFDLADYYGGLEAHKSRKKIAREKLVQQAETDPAAAAELAKQRAYSSEATKKSRQKMYEEAATGNPEAVERYENYLASRREAYHRKKQESERTA